jgi:hypothetical protein
MDQEPGRPCLSFTKNNRSHGSRRSIPTEARQRAHATPGEEEAQVVKVGPSEGNRSEGTKEGRESEGPIGAKTSGNGRHPDPAEQRGPVLM